MGGNSTSVEHNPEWFTKIESKLQGHYRDVKLKVIGNYILPKLYLLGIFSPVKNFSCVCV